MRKVREVLESLPNFYKITFCDSLWISALYMTDDLSSFWEITFEAPDEIWYKLANPNLEVDLEKWKKLEPLYTQSFEVTPTELAVEDVYFDESGIAVSKTFPAIGVYPLYKVRDVKSYLESFVDIFHELADLGFAAFLRILEMEEENVQRN